MDFQSWLEFAALGVACASLWLTYLRTARMQGSERQRIRALESAIIKLATAESVAALATRLDALEGEVKLVATALTKVAVIESKLDSLDRLMMRETDEIKHSLRALKARRAPVG
jgi:hypothetical protein